MFIGVGIDSDHYTDLDYFFGETVYEVKEKFREYLKDSFTEDDPIVWQENNEGKAIRGETKTNNYYWYVAEIFEVPKLPKHKWYLVWYHAYNGVGFKVNSFSREVFAQGQMRVEFSDFLTEFAQYVCDAHLDHDSAIIDDGNEWNIWKIIKEGN